ncbi:MAG: YggT family protein [Betaproteobacteria bacterium]|nr:YggT family protein [Betaproteobacteria bacterium]
MISQALSFLLETLLGLFALALLLRFYLQLFRAAYRNPLTQFLSALTDFAVRPARRIVPGLWGVDLATLVLAWVTQLVLLYALLSLKGYELKGVPLIAFAGLAALALVELVKLSAWIFMVAVIVQAVLSWINPYSPIAPVLNSFTRPFLRPFQKRIPPIGNVDLSPLFVIIALQLILMLPVRWLEMSIARLF